MERESRWSLIAQAAAGDELARGELAARYLPLVRGYLRARWRGKPIARELEDAVQDVFLDLLREGGALLRAQDRGLGFRGFLYGVTRHVAQRKESERARHGRKAAADTLLATLTTAESSLTARFDRQWAVSVMRETMRVMAAEAEHKGPEAERRIELLRLRYYDEVPVREIARLWEVAPDRLHHQLEQAKIEFQRAWCEIMGLRDAAEPRVSNAWREFLQVFAKGSPSSAYTASVCAGAAP